MKQSETLKECIENLMKRLKNGGIEVSKEEYDDYAKFFIPQKRIYPMTVNGYKLTIKDER